MSLLVTILDFVLWVGAGLWVLDTILVRRMRKVARLMVVCKRCDNQMRWSWWTFGFRCDCGNYVHEQTVCNFVEHEPEAAGAKGLLVR